MIRRCVESIVRADGPRCVLVVDNGSHPEVPVERYGPGVGAVLRVPNAGFGAAVNAGLVRLANRLPSGVQQPRYVAVLNDDVEVGAHWLAPLLEELESDDRLGAVQPKLLLADGGHRSDQPSRINSVGVGFDAAGAGSDIGLGEVDGPSWSETSDIEAFTGGAALLRRSFLDDVGGFDERYFLYYEDVDLALRGAERGWRYRCVPASTVVHAPGSSSADMGDRLHYLRERNRIWTTIRFRDAGTNVRSLSLAARRLRHRPRRAHLRALLAGLVAAPRLLLERRRAGRGR